jgi:peptidyl-prolyl cis-trans isomerase A (cyclophilin A)
LAEATRDLKGSGALVATIDTSKGKLTCNLYEDKAPLTVANFVGLATGKRSWLDPVSGEWVNKRAYDGTTFHRVIKGFMIQGGDAKGDGTGEPGYVIPDEMWTGATHDRAGLLCMANRGANTNGAQFFITDSDGPSVKNLDRLHSYTIFGSCAPIDAIHAMASVETGARDRPVTPLTINSVKIARAPK